MASDLGDLVVTDREPRDVYGLDDGGGIREAGTPAARAKRNTRYAARVLVMSHHGVSCGRSKSGYVAARVWT